MYKRSGNNKRKRQNYMVNSYTSGGLAVTSHSSANIPLTYQHETSKEGSFVSPEWQQDAFPCWESHNRRLLRNVIDTWGK